MLKHIIKRDGTVEDFIPHKVNRWVEWTTRGLEGRCEWSSIVLDSIRSFTDTVHSQELQKALVKTCLLKRDWPHNIMAGRLYTAILRKEFYNNDIPTVRELQAKLSKMGLMRVLDYTEDEYETIESFIDHQRDLEYAHFQIRQLVNKYSIQNRISKQTFETPQFIFIRMAMALAEKSTGQARLEDVKNFYQLFSRSILNAPTPNYINLGTSHNGYASCCLYTVNDTAASLAIGDHIAYTMTYMSAGIGSNLNVRSVGDPVRNGAIKHMGKMPYYRALGSAVRANVQAGRGGSCTTYLPIFDPEIQELIVAYNPRTPVAKQNRDLHYAIMSNRLFAKKVARNEPIFLFNTFTAPDLTEAFYSGDKDHFEALYNQYEQDPTFNKTYINARSLLVMDSKESFNVATHYHFVIDEANRHTPFKDTIYSSNLCLEITEPTQAYENIQDLYSEEDHGKGEVALCNLAAINVTDTLSDEDYEKAAYYSLKMIDETIHLTDYALPHVGFTAKQRLNAGVGMIGTATHLARKGLRYDTPEGLKELHFLAERHAYFLIKASLQLGKERGNAPWIHKTKWVDGWLPIDTYKKDVDLLVSPVYHYDWESLRIAIIENGGIRNSSLVAHMPTESSSKASGASNSIYPIRNLFLKKTDQNMVLDWCPVDGDLLEKEYQLAWNIKSVDMIKMYAVHQKFADHSISADLYKDRTNVIEISDTDMVAEYLAMIKYGVKSRYYQNSLISKRSEEVNTVSQEVIITEPEPVTDEYGYTETTDTKGCAGGVCTL